MGTKQKYRGKWIDEFEEVTNATVYDSDDLPVDVESEDGVIFAYTDDMYDFSEEQVLLMITTGERIGRDLPTKHGWIVHNTESLYNISRALRDDTPVTRKYVHVDGSTPLHRCLEVPVGTPATELLKAADCSLENLGDDYVLADGGPGWCYEIEEAPDEFGVRKRTNAILVLNRDEVEEHTEQQGRINVLNARNWNDHEHETEPTRLYPESVRVPLITNAAYTDLVAPSEPIVEPGEWVTEGDPIATRGDGDISNTQHASIDGKIVDVTDQHVLIKRE